MEQGEHVVQRLNECNILIVLQVILEPGKLNGLNSFDLLLYLIHLNKQRPTALIQSIQVFHLLLTLVVEQFRESMSLILPFLQPQS